MTFKCVQCEREFDELPLIEALNMVIRCEECGNLFCDDCWSKHRMVHKNG